MWSLTAASQQSICLIPSQQSKDVELKKPSWTRTILTLVQSGRKALHCWIPEVKNSKGDGRDHNQQGKLQGSEGMRAEMQYQQSQTPGHHQEKQQQCWGGFSAFRNPDCCCKPVELNYCRAASLSWSGQEINPRAGLVCSCSPASLWPWCGGNHS